MPTNVMALTLSPLGDHMESIIDIDRLIAIRGAKGWDQKQLADAASVDKSVISRLERRLQTDCRLSVLLAIAVALEVPIERLVQQNVMSKDLLSPELEANLERLKNQSLKNQKHAALILNAFLDGLDG